MVTWRNNGEELKEVHVDISPVPQGDTQTAAWLARMLQQKQQAVLTMEILATGSTAYSHLSLRELFDYIQRKISDVTDQCAPNRPNSAENALPPRQIRGEVAQTLKARDLRKLGMSAASESVILVRRHCILFGFDVLRGVVLWDRLIVLVPDGADSLLLTLNGYLVNSGDSKPSEENGSIFSSFDERTSEETAEPFEVRALEAVLSSVVHFRSREYAVLNTRVEKLIKRMSKAAVVSAEMQERLRVVKNSATGLSVRVHRYQKTLEEVLENDEDMALMNLSKLRENPWWYQLPLQPEILQLHEKFELLFEAYSQDFNTESSRVETLQHHLNTMQELLSLRLDTARNQLLSATTVFALVSMCCGAGSLVGSIFGMNLTSNWENNPTYFQAVTAITCGMVLLSGVATFMFFQARGIFVG